MNVFNYSALTISPMTDNFITPPVIFQTNIPVFGANGNKLGRIPPVIPKGGAGRGNAVFVVVFFHPRYCLETFCWLKTTKTGIISGMASFFILKITKHTAINSNSKEVRFICPNGDEVKTHVPAV